ncbi:hypothetical protein PGTUg99_003348 [Puccinia graminis f. sp. tritici]|uniref:Uncharacterized protein n=1 Tax=Puccinia graminis f. sp. tritici TaxID=56615 RepID=A0A5B0QGS9_PUCGR|nr:hypothetical protein PGTUg99_003348 [Puccinia graminis f. sp. tritici]
MRCGLCASVLQPLVWFLIARVSTHEDLGIPIELIRTPDIVTDRAGSTIEFQQLACPEDSERRALASTEALPLFPVTPGELSTNKKRVPGILAEEDHLVTKRRTFTETRKDDDGDNQLPARPYTSPTFPARATFRFDKPSLALEEDHQMPATVSPNSLPPAAPDMNSNIAETLLSEIRRTKLIPSGSTNHILAKGFSHSDASPMHPYKKKLASAAATSTGTGNQQKEFWQALSKQTRDWNPPVISQTAALATHFMAIEFQQALSNIAWSSELNELHQTHRILIPFVYKLMMKPLNTENWSLILLIWRNLWHEEEESIETDVDRTRRASRDEVLKKFLWISDFISEATIPELFRDVASKYGNGSTLTTAKHVFHLSNHESRMIKLLSDGRTPLRDLSKNQLQAIDYLKGIRAQECESGNANSNIESTGSEEPAPWMWVLDRLKDKALPITPEPSKIEGMEKRLSKEGKWEMMRENVWDKVYCRATVLGPEACQYLIKYPPSLKKKIDHLFNLLLHHHPPNFPVSSVPYLRLDYLISQFDHHFGRASIPMANRNFLSDRIHEWFDEKFQKLLQKQSSVS